MYLRYIDDIFLIWNHSREDLDLFITHLNSQVDSIKFSSEITHTSVNFLDMKVQIRDNRIFTDLNTKPTDSHEYLLYNSAHTPKYK